MARAVAALRQCGGQPYRLIAVEQEPQHFAWMVEHLRENGVDLDRCRLIRAAVADVDGEVWFHVGKPDAWYGQAIAAGPPEEPPGGSATSARKEEPKDDQSSIERVQAVSLDTLLRPLERVDLIDLDVQGAELMVLRAAVDQLDQKVKRVHIGTHSVENEAGLRTLFRDLGWHNLHDYSLQGTRQTPWGLIEFGDGVQTWINRALVPTSARHRGPTGTTGDPQLDALTTPASARDESEQLRGEAERLRAALDASEAGRRAVRDRLLAVRAELERAREEVLTLKGRLRAAGEDPGIVRERLTATQAELKRARGQIQGDALDARLAAGHVVLAGARPS